MFTLKMNCVSAAIFCLYPIIVNTTVLGRNFSTERGILDSLVNSHIPTIRSTNAKCRNHSLYYVEELKKYTLWAAEMFDATTKFPTGVLYGSSYDFGNFDECMEVRAAYRNELFVGRYCLSKFIINIPYNENITSISKIDYEFGDYEKYYNISLWTKINDYLEDKSRSPRNELHLAFCLPSSCTHKDLQEALEDIIDDINNQTTISINLEVEENNCQTNGEHILFDVGDKIFIFLISIAIFNVTMASIYDLLTKRDDFSQYRFEGRLHKAMLCFSFKKNFDKLTANNTNVDGLNCIAGMKVYSMFLIILLHRNMFDFGSAVTNPKTIERYYSMFGLTFILNGPILVDTFFTISGFLATYLTLHHYYHKTNRRNVLMLYIHRYIRMTPTYAVIIAFYCTLFVKLGSGPLWQERVGSERNKCRIAWWANILFINNYVETSNYCMFQSWYMACDMNAFIFIPILCLMLRETRIVVSAVISLIIASTVIVFVTVYVNNEQPILLLYMRMLLHPSEDSTFLKIYIPGHMRAASYFVGVLAGYLKYNMNLSDFKIPRHWVRMGWISSALLLFLSLHVSFIFYIMEVPTWASALYASLHHFCWSLSIAWMIIAISSGYGPWVEPILSWSPLVILSRLTYTVYLCHGAIQIFFAGIIRKPIYASAFNSIHSTAADIILAHVLALILTILFESPLIALEKVIFSQDSHRKDNTKTEHKMESAIELPTVN